MEDTTNYVVVDQLVAGMSAVFSSCLAQVLDNSLIRWELHLVLVIIMVTSNVAYTTITITVILIACF